MDILGPDGAAALAAAAAEPNPDSLAAATRLRKRFSPELAAAALTQVSLRRRAAGKFSRPDDVFLTPTGLEQSTRLPVARWRARRFADAGVAEAWDLGCGLGADAMALQEAGVAVHAVEADPTTAAFATANLALVGGEPATLGRAEDVDPPPGAGIFLDPARRTGAGRTWAVADFTPRWDLVTGYLAGDRFTCVKLGPGLPKELIPDGVQAAWVSHRGDVVEVSLWNQRRPARVAVVMPSEGPTIELSDADPAADLAVADVGRFVLEPDNAVIRSGLIAQAAHSTGAWLLADGVAYLSTDTPVASALFDCFEVLDVLPFDIVAVRRWLAARQVGTVEIKKRAVDVDPAALRRKLKPSGPHTATIILARTPSGTRAVMASRR